LIQTDAGAVAACETARADARSCTVGTKARRTISGMASGAGPAKSRIGVATPASRTATASSKEPVASQSAPSAASTCATSTAPWP
jgi:hypothetical protein